MARQKRLGQFQEGLAPKLQLLLIKPGFINGASENFVEPLYRKFQTRTVVPTKADLPPFDSLFKPSIESFKVRGGSMTIEEMEEAVANAIQLPDELRAIPHGDGPRSQFEYELAWVRTYLKKVGALENSERGVWHLTSAGADMSDSEVSAIPKRVREQDRLRRAQRGATEDIPDSEEVTDVSWRDSLLATLLKMQTDAFERLCQRVLRESGFTKVEVTGRSGDGGIDGTGVLRLNLLSFHVLFSKQTL